MRTRAGAGLFRIGGVLRFVAVLAAGIALGLAAGGLLAAEDGTITACVAKRTGILKIPKAGECSDPDRALTWNRQGPPGPAGEQGPQGERGPAGPANVVMRQADGGPLQGGGAGGGIAWCEEGERVVGGGFAGKDDPAAAQRSRPIYEDGREGWEAFMYPTWGGSSTTRWTTYALCASS